MAQQYEVQALIGYKGYSDLFYRHESVLSMQAQTVHEKDKFDYEYAQKASASSALGDRGRRSPTTLSQKCRAAGCYSS